MNCISKVNCFHAASSFMLLAVFASFNAIAQIPKPLLKLVEKHNKVQSGYVKLQRIDINIYNDTTLCMEEAFFISTLKDLKSLVYTQDSYTSTTHCKSAYSFATIRVWSYSDDISYSYNNDFKNAKSNSFLSYFMADRIYVDDWKAHKFQLIPPKINRKNVRYQIRYPDKDILSNISREWEFDRKTFHLIQDELSLTYAETFPMYVKIDILEHRLYEYIHPCILDTISFKFEEIKKGYDRQQAVEQSIKDSLLAVHLTDSITRSITQSGGTWSENMSQDIQQEKQFFMPEWNFPLLSGDMLYSDSIKSQYLLIDMWYIACPPCIKAMAELSSIDTLYDESLLKIISLNVSDKDTAKINRVIRNLNPTCQNYPIKSSNLPKNECG